MNDFTGNIAILVILLLTVILFLTIFLGLIYVLIKSKKDWGLRVPENRLVFLILGFKPVANNPSKKEKLTLAFVVIFFFAVFVIFILAMFGVFGK